MYDGHRRSSDNFGISKMFSTATSMRLDCSFDSDLFATMANPNRLSETAALCDGTRLASKRVMRLVLLHEKSKGNIIGPRIEEWQVCEAIGCRKGATI